MLEIPERVNYGEWDNSDFIIPEELLLTSDSFLHNAIQVFYKAGGFDFFKVINPTKYSTKWLDFVGGLYADIEEGKYKSDGEYHKNPLSGTDRLSLREQGVPDLFIDDIDGQIPISRPSVKNVYGSIVMINKLHLAMIRLYSGDAKRIQHFCKVHSYAKLIAETEKVDEKTLFIIEAAALTHDIGIHYCEEKYGGCGGKLQEKEGPAIAKKLLDELNFDSRTVERVQYLIAHHHTYDNIDGVDLQILIEADFLVNLYEDGLSKQAAEQAYKNIFKTNSGKKILREMFGSENR